MARAVFQVQSSSDRPTVGPIKRSSDRSLHITEASSKIIACLPFKKFQERVEPVRCADAYAQILSCQVNKAETPNSAWILLEFFHGRLSNFLSQDQHIIPFWTSYFGVTSKSSPSSKEVTYPPIVDAKPNDMTTVYTIMKRCVEMCTKAGQQHSIQIFDQVKWSNPEDSKIIYYVLEAFTRCLVSQHALANSGMMAVYQTFWLSLGYMFYVQQNICYQVNSLIDTFSYSSIQSTDVFVVVNIF